MAANLMSDPYRLEATVMPLVRLLARGNLSWSDKQAVTDAIRACHIHYDEMMAEGAMLAQGGGGSQQSSNK